MNRTRLEKVRNTIRELNAIQPGQRHAKTEVVTSDAVLTHYPDRIATIETLDMGTYHSKIYEKEGDCQTLGCIAGVAIKLYPKEARNIAATADDGSPERRGPADIAQRILDLSTTEGRALFLSYPVERSRRPVTPPQACAAIDRLLNGVNPENIWQRGGGQVLTNPS